jgi:MFS family permease
MASTFLSDGAREGLRYGALISVVSAGGTPLDSAVLGAVALLPPTLLGLLGGTIADALPRRATLIFVYVLQALACFLIPSFLGTSFWNVAALIFSINVFGQVCGPTEQSLAPLFVSDTQIASANSLLGLSSSAGAICGAALVAPIVVALFSVRALFWVSGTMLLLAANRVVGVRGTRRPPAHVRRLKQPRVSAVRWLASEPAIATMVALAVLAGTANIVVQVLGPQYVADVLGVSPDRAVYVFAPSTLGLVLALVAAPALMHRIGERRSAAVGLLVTVAALMSLGLVGERLEVALDPINPLRALARVGINMSASLRTAGLLAVPLGFGVSLTTTAVQTYINRRVPLTLQGRAFALQSTLKNGAAIAPLLALGAIASVVGVAAVLVVSPLLLVAVGVTLLRLSEHFGAHRPATRLETLESFWFQPEPTAGLKTL